MSVFYIDSESEGIFELTTTTDIRVSQTARATKHPIEDGSNAIDHVVNDNTSISFDGIISDIIRLNPSDVGANSQRDVEGFISSLRRLRNNRELFTVYYDNREFGVADRCYITNLNVERSSSTGTGYKVSLAFEEVRVVDQAIVTTSTDDQSDPDLTQDSTDSSGSNTQDVGDDWTEGKVVLSDARLVGSLLGIGNEEDGGQ